MKKATNAVILAAMGMLFINMPIMAKSCCPHEKSGKQDKICPEGLEGVETVKKNIDNGVEMIISARSAETILKTQETAAAHYADEGKHCKCLPKGAEIKVENLENGVKVLITGNTPKLIKKIQAKSAKVHDCKGHNKSELEKAAGVKEGNKAAYICPMGCARSEKPGKCPKCGMNLVEKK